MTFSGLPGNAPRVFVPTERTVQRLVAAPATQAVSATAAASLEPRFTPQVSTRTRDVLALSLRASLNAPIEPTRFGVFRM